jgi:MFS family permease
MASALSRRYNAQQQPPLGRLRVLRVAESISDKSPSTGVLRLVGCGHGRLRAMPRCCSIVVFSFGVFFKPLSQEFHSAPAAVSLAFSLQNLTAAACAPLIGRLIDRLGARRVILPGTAIFGLILLSSKTLGAGIGYLYVFFIALGIIQDCTSPLSYSTVVSHWFNRHRGLALGFMIAGISLGAIGVPLAAQRTWDSIGHFFP